MNLKQTVPPICMNIYFFFPLSSQEKFEKIPSGKKIEDLTIEKKRKTPTCLFFLSFPSFSFLFEHHWEFFLPAILSMMWKGLYWFKNAFKKNIDSLLNKAKVFSLFSKFLTKWTKFEYAIIENKWNRMVRNYFLKLS